jgi:hypothetical protein
MGLVLSVDGSSVLMKGEYDGRSSETGDEGVGHRAAGGFRWRPVAHVDRFVDQERSGEVKTKLVQHIDLRTGKVVVVAEKERKEEKK